MESPDTKMTMKNIKPAYATNLGTGVFMAEDICPKCGFEMYFDAGNGWYECENCGHHTKREY